MVRRKNFTRDKQRNGKLYWEVWGVFGDMADAMDHPAPSAPPSLLPDRVGTPATRNSISKEEWRERAHKLTDEATDLHNEIVDRDTTIAELESKLKTTESELQKKTASLDNHLNTLQTTESQAGDAISEVQLELQQARDEIKALKEAHKKEIDLEKQKNAQAQSLVDSAYTDATNFETQLAKAKKERDEAIAISTAQDEALKETQERFAEHEISNANEFLELILADVAPVLREQDLDVTAENIINQFLSSRNSATLKRTESDASIGQRSIHSRNDSHHRLGGRKTSLHHELSDSANEDDTDYLFEDTGKDHWAKDFDDSTPLKSSQAPKSSWLPNLPPMTAPVHDAPTPRKTASHATDAPVVHAEQAQLAELRAENENLREKISELEEEIAIRKIDNKDLGRLVLEDISNKRQIETLSSECNALRESSNARRADSVALQEKLAAAEAKHTIITQSHPRQATLWENLTQLPWWLKALMVLFFSLCATLSFAAYVERKKWIDANDLSWEITPYDLGRGYSYGTGYNYDYGGGYSDNRFIRWLADDVFKLTSMPYD